MELFMLKPDGSYQDYANIPDAVWAANQTQIAQWVQAQGFTYYIDTASDPDPAVLTYTTIDQVQAWIYRQIPPSRATASAEAPPATSAASSPAATSSSSTAPLVAGGVAAAVVAVVWWLVKRAA